LTRDEALVVLQGGEFEPFVGQREDLELEFKGQPYQLDEETGKFELAKDVAALANGTGGVILIGIETERQEDSPLDEAVRVRPLGRRLVDTTRYEAVVGERVYPPIQGLRVEFKPTVGDAERGLVLIDVPPQAETDKLFLVLKALSEGSTAPGWLVGIAVRSVGRVDVRRPAEIHGLITRGFTLTDRLDALTGEVGLIREHLEEGAGVPAPQSPADRLPQLLEERIAELEETIVVDGDVAYLYLAAAPMQSTHVQTLTRQEGIRQLLEKPPFTRYEGWNLVTLDQAQLVGGRRLRLTNGARKHIDLYEDGTFLAFGTLEDFLAWHRRELPDKLNSLALIEFVYNFLLVYDRILGDLDPLPHAVRLAIGLRHAHPAAERQLYLSFGRVDRHDYEADLDVREAPDGAVDRETDVEVADADPHFDLGTATYRLVVQLYNWFGFPDEAVPYTNAERTAVEINEIVRPG
jgi:hypothetical protein